MTKLKKHTKSLIQRWTPWLLNELRVIKYRYSFKRKYSNQRIEIASIVYPDGDITIKTGAFEGMKYLNETVWGSIIPKWFRSYESELRPTIEEILQNDYSNVIDIGCADGYYACGLAYRMTQCQIHAYDVDIFSRNQVKKLARLNGLENRIHIGKLCTFDDINRIADHSTLVFCDIEGAERELLDPESCKSLIGADVLVEIHENNPSVSTIELISSRFNRTHTITTIYTTDRLDWVLQHEEQFSDIQREDMLYMVTERRRFSDCWLWMKAGIK